MTTTTNPLVVLVIILSLLGNAPFKQVGGAEVNECHCKYLIHRSVMVAGECGPCAQCWWNLLYYSQNFSPFDPTLPDPKGLEGLVEACAQRIPSHPIIQVFNSFRLCKMP